MRPRGLAFLAASLLAVCVTACQPAGDEALPRARESSGLSAGRPDPGHLAVVGLVRADDPTVLRCTGTAISDHVVLTAAHCNVHLDPTAYLAFFGSDLASATQLVGIVAGVGHPSYDETAEADLALLLLAKPAPAKVTLATEPLIAATPPVALRLVGFGMTAPDAGNDDLKREGWTKTTEVQPTFVTLGANPSLPCSGDSGGPVFLPTAAGEVLAAVVSRGDAACSSYSKATRVDPYVSTFIKPFVAANAPGSASDGQTCVYDAQCVGGLCLTAADEPSLEFCSRACLAGEACQAGMTCQAGQCRYSLPSPGAFASACAKTAQCLRGACLKELGICSHRCVTGTDDCPGGYTCEYLGGVDFYCVPAPPPPDGDSCTAARHGEGGSGGFLLTIATLFAAGRRRSPGNAARRTTRQSR